MAKDMTLTIVKVFFLFLVTCFIPINKNTIWARIRGSVSSSLKTPIKDIINFKNID